MVRLVSDRCQLCECVCVCVKKRLTKDRRGHLSGALVFGRAATRLTDDCSVEIGSFAWFVGDALDAS